MKLKHLTKRAVIAIALVISLSSPIYAKSVMVDNVVYMNQYPELPTGCEVTALAILMNQSGFNVTKEELANKITKRNVPTYKNGKLYGESPHNAFIGNPYSKSSYGVFLGPIIELMGYYMDDYRIEDLTGKSFEDILTVVESGRGVMVIATSNLVEPTASVKWVLPNGEEFTWLANEHSMVIEGYNEKSVFASEPRNGKLVEYDRKLFKKRWEQMGSQAVAIKGEYDEKDIYVIGKGKIDTALVDKNNAVWIPIKLLGDLDKNISVNYANSETLIIRRTKLGKDKISIKNGIATMNKNTIDLHNKIYKDRLYIREDGLKKYFNKRIINNKSSITII